MIIPPLRLMLKSFLWLTVQVSQRYHRAVQNILTRVHMVNGANSVADAVAGRDDARIPAFLSSQPGSATVIGEDAVFNGDISMRADQDLLVHGCVVGSIFHAGKVVIGTTGVLIGSIYASELEVHGVVDASEGEILATALLSHSTSHINAAKATVGSGGLSYERGAFLSANLGMLNAGEVADRLAALLKVEDDKAQSRREAIARARQAHQPVALAVAAAPATVVPLRAYSSATELVSASSTTVLAAAAASSDTPLTALPRDGGATFGAGLGLPGVDDDLDETSSLDRPGDSA